MTKVMTTEIAEGLARLKIALEAKEAKKAQAPAKVVPAPAPMTKRQARLMRELLKELGNI